MSNHWTLALDFIHRRHDVSSSPSTHSTRALKAHVFGADIPAYIIFHAVMGYVLLFVGLCAILIRLPLNVFRKRRWMHHYLGYLWVFGTIWIPVTAIWCVYRFTGWDVIAFFIFSMYAAIQAGWLCMRVYRGKERQYSEDRSSSIEGSSKTPWKIKLWKAFHAVFMIYSFAMLLGAGISFPFRANNDLEDVWRQYGAI